MAWHIEWTQMGAHLNEKLWTGVGTSALQAMGTPGWVATQFCLSALLFLVEVVASRLSGSLLLLSCSFHTLGGALTLGLALTEAWLAAGGCCGRRNTFGWARARVMGTLVNAVLLSSLSLALVPEALRMLTEPRLVEHVLVLMGIGAVGIPIHLARAGWQERCCQDSGNRPCCNQRRDTRVGNSAHETEDLLGNESSVNKESWTEDEGLPTEEDVSPVVPAGSAGPWQALWLGWTGACLGPVMVFLYFLTLHLLWTPCLGHAACVDRCFRTSCGVLESSQLEQAPCWLLYLDPGLAIVVVVTLLILVWPPLRRSALVLLQAVPEGLNLQLLELQLRATEGVAALKELNIWQLDGPGSLVATAHVCCPDVAAFGAAMEQIQRVFCDHGIHIATVEPDFYTCRSTEGCGSAPCRRRQVPGSAVIVEYETTV